MTFYFNTACLPSGKNRSLVAAKPGLSALVNKTVGMPVPSDAFRYYHEYIIPAGEPLTIRAQISEQIFLANGKKYIETTRASASTFVPRSGQDYEVIVDKAYGTARIQARHLSPTDAGISTEPVKIDAAGACKNADAQ